MFDMKKIYFFFIAGLSGFLFNLPAMVHAQGSMKLSTGASLHMTAGTVLTINNLDLENDGTVSSAGTIRFTGNVNTAIKGNTNLALGILEIAKSGDAEVQLERELTINTAISFTSGHINLNGHTIFLQSNAILDEESVSSSIKGAIGGYIETSRILNAPVSQNPGNLGAIISSSQNLGNVIIRRGHQSQANTAGNGNSILRYYEIIPANNTVLNATLRFNYFDTELNGLSENGLVLWKSDGNSNWSNEGYSSRDAGINYVEKTGIADFTRWTLSSPGNALPVEFVFFNSNCDNGKVFLTWKTAQEMNSSHFDVERSANGSNWAVIGSVPAAGNSNIERAYQFTDNLPIPGALYRIAQYDLDGKNKYSVIIRSSCDGSGEIRVWPNPAQSMAWVNIVTQIASPVNIRLYDNKGAIVYTRKLSLSGGSNQLPIPLYRLSNGIYEVVVDFMNGKTKAYKLVKN
jgi:riboflavin synthase alpha subunit